MRWDQKIWCVYIYNIKLMTLFIPFRQFDIEITLFSSYVTIKTIYQRHEESQLLYISFNVRHRTAFEDRNNVFTPQRQSFIQSCCVMCLAKWKFANIQYKVNNFHRMMPLAAFVSLEICIQKFVFENPSIENEVRQSYTYKFNFHTNVWWEMCITDYGKQELV